MNQAQIQTIAPSSKTGWGLRLGAGIGYGGKWLVGDGLSQMETNRLRHYKEMYDNAEPFTALGGIAGAAGGGYLAYKTADEIEALKNKRFIKALIAVGGAAAGGIAGASLSAAAADAIQR